MLFAVFVNIIWIIWSLVTLISGFGLYEGAHSHTYAYLFFAGMVAIILGSLWLKALWFRGTPSSLVRIGFVFWLTGFLLFLASLFAGANLPRAHVLKEHVLFNHVNFIVFLLGAMLSVYVDTLIVARLDKPRESSSTA